MLEIPRYRDTQFCRVIYVAKLHFWRHNCQLASSWQCAREVVDEDAVLDVVGRRPLMSRNHVFGDIIVKLGKTERRSPIVVVLSAQRERGTDSVRRRHEAGKLSKSVSERWAVKNRGEAASYTLLVPRCLLSFVCTPVYIILRKAVA
jgi:hypothetical protein